MPYRRVAPCADHYYHVYNRGVNRQPIFFGDDNYGFFVQRLRHYFQPGLVDIVAYCLMPTHYHLLVHVKADGLATRVIQPCSLSYARAVNRQQGRVGPLFQGRFRAILVETDDYLLHLSRYIHRNPIAAGLVRRAQEWAYSSYRDYTGLRHGTLPYPEIVLSQFPSRQAYREFVESWREEDVEKIKHRTLE